MAMRLCHPLQPSSLPIVKFRPKSLSPFKFSIQNRTSNSDNPRQLLMQVKQKLEKDHHSLPTGRNGRDDEDMILWFLKDRKFSVEEAIAKLTKAIQVQAYCQKNSQDSLPYEKKWRQEFGVSKLNEESVGRVAETGKSYVHDFLDVNNRPVLIVVASKHFPGIHDPIEDEKLCVFLIEKALSKLPAGKEQILGIVDLRGFGTENADLKFLTFLFDVFYYYYPKRLGEVLFMEAPFVFKPIWQMAKPLLKSYASLILLSGDCEEGIFYSGDIASKLSRLKDSLQEDLGW